MKTSVQKTELRQKFNLVFLRTPSKNRGKDRREIVMGMERLVLWWFIERIVFYKGKGIKVSTRPPEDHVFLSMLYYKFTFLPTQFL